MLDSAGSVYETLLNVIDTQSQANDSVSQSAISTAPRTCEKKNLNAVTI